MSLRTHHMIGISPSLQINSPGTYYPYHIILKNGALDFCAVVPFQKAKSCPLLILQEKVDITVSLVPQTKGD